MSKHLTILEKLKNLSDTDTTHKIFIDYSIKVASNYIEVLESIKKSQTITDFCCVVSTFELNFIRDIQRIVPNIKTIGCIYDDELRDTYITFYLGDVNPKSLFQISNLNLHNRNELLYESFLSFGIEYLYATPNRHSEIELQPMIGKNIEPTAETC